MGTYHLIRELAELTSIQGLTVTSAKLYEALYMLSTEESEYTPVENLISGETYYAKPVDVIAALRMAHSDLCGCLADKFIYTENTIGLCSYYVKVDTTRYLWKKACKHDGIPEDTKFAVFSNDNPYDKLLDTI